jgi:flagellar basal-body rod modification protein FlgD
MTAPISPLANSASSAASATTGAGSATSFASTLGPNDFLTLLSAQLQYQDPTNPMDSSNLTAELAQFSELSNMQQLNSNFSNLMALQSITQGASLVGKSIVYSSPDGSTTNQGTVSSVQINNGQLGLLVGGNTVSLNQVQGIAAS